jgi:hypothetical protein
VLSRYMSTSEKDYRKVVKRIFRYLCGTKYYAICYQGKPIGESELYVHGFVDADWAGDLDRQRSTSGYVFKMFSGEISWMSKWQTVVSI